MTNPYESPAENKASDPQFSSTSRLAIRSLSKWFTIPVGTIAGALLAATAAGGLAFAALETPWSRHLGLGGEFDVFLVIGLPLLALPTGALGGLLFGCIWKRHRSWLIAVSIASLPAVAYFFIGAWADTAWKNPRDQFLSTTVTAICWILALAVSLKLLDSTFVFMERRRSAKLEEST